MNEDYTVEDLLSRVDIIDIVGQHVTLKKQGSEYVGLCPFHQEKTPSFSIEPKDQFFYCFGCGASGSAYGFIKDFHGLSGADTYTKLKEYARIHEVTDTPIAPIKRESVKPVDNWQPLMPIPSGAPKLMDGGKTSPIFNPKTDEYKTYTPEPEGVYPYRDQNGDLLGAVLKIFIKGKKITPTVTYCVNTESGEEKWCLKGFPEPKPLYNIDRWHGHDMVLLVEGESCVDAADSKLGHKYDVVSWPNGTNAIHKVDWSLLYGRNVIAWADHDLHEYKKGEHEGTIKPQDEQNGRIAMMTIGKELVSNGSAFVLLNQPDSKPDGWDCADAVEEGYDLDQYINDHMPKQHAKPNPVDTTEPDADEPEQKPVQPAQDEPDQIVKPLGYDGSSYYYYSTLTQQLRELKDREHTESRMLGLADLEWWELNFPKKTGFDSSAAASWMMSACRLKGIFDPKTIRGRGCWIDDGRFVIHLGDRIIADGETKNLNNFKSKYLYQAARRKKAPQNALSDEEAKGLLESAKAFDWDMPASGALLAGFCVLAPICGALEWRPHLWLTGGSGSGKSSVLRHYIKNVIGDMAIYTNFESTSAGLRQDLNSDAMPCIIEEFEPTTMHERDKAKGFFGLMRLASDDNGTRVLRGSTDGKASGTELNTIFCLIGIQICTTEQAILNRTAKLSLRSKNNKTESEKQANAEAWRKIQAVLDKNVLGIENLSSRLFARTIGMIGTINYNIKIFRSAATKHFGNARYADQYGTLLAGAYSLASDCKIKEETALRYIESFDWTSYTEDSDTDESDQALSSIMQIMLRVEGVGIMHTRSVGEWVMYVKDKTLDDERFGWHDVDSALKRSGIRCEPEGITISNKSDFLKRELKDNPWSQNWNRYLKRVVTSRGYDSGPSKTIYFAPGLNSRGVLIPYTVLDNIGG